MHDDAGYVAARSGKDPVALEVAVLAVMLADHVAVSRSAQPRPRTYCLGNSLDSGGPGSRSFGDHAMALEAHGQADHGP